MSKRLHDATQGESEEDRWMRKLKMYEEKLVAKRRRQAERQQAEKTMIEGEVQTEEPSQHNTILPAGSPVPVIEEVTPITAENESAYDFQYDEYLREIGFDEVSLMTETTACTSPGSNTVENIVSDVVGDFDPHLLRELGDAEADPIEFGDDLQADVAARFQKILLEGLKKESKEELLKRYPFPKNVSLAKGPTLNPEIGAMLAETCKLRDKRLLHKQDQLGKALTALGRALTGLLKKTPDIPEVIRTLNDAGKLLSDSHYTETDTRRSVLIPLIDKSLTDPFKDRKRDSFLFGEKLGELVKDSRGIKKTGQLIQPSTSTNSNLNGRGPSSRARQQRGGHTYNHRAGGPRAVATASAYPYHPYHPYRRRAAPLPPPQTTRRQPAPPQPPAPAPVRRAPAAAQRPSTSRQM